MKKLTIPFLILLTTLLFSCKCKQVNDQLVDGYTASLFPYSQDQQLHFRSNNNDLKTMLVYYYSHSTDPISESDDKLFSRNRCYDYEEYNIELADTVAHKAMNIHLYPGVEDGDKRHSSSIRFFGYGFNVSNYYASDYLILDTMTLGSVQYNEVLVMDTATCPGSFNPAYTDIIRLYFAPAAGIIRYETNDGQAWTLEN